MVENRVSENSYKTTPLGIFFNCRQVIGRKTVSVPSAETFRSGIDLAAIPKAGFRETVTLSLYITFINVQAK